jgi:hypothetical protein
MANGTVAASQLEMLTLSGTGVITVVPPNTNTNRTITLPDSTGTVQTVDGVLTQFNASGSAPVYACRAWVNFNGTGTVAIRASGNVSSITDNGTGDYTVNFTTAMPDANYSFQGTASQASTGNNGNTCTILESPPPTTSSIRFRTQQDNVGVTDSAFSTVAVFR